MRSARPIVYLLGVCVAMPNTNIVYKDVTSMSYVYNDVMYMCCMCNDVMYMCCMCNDVMSMCNDVMYMCCMYKDVMCLLVQGKKKQELKRTMEITPSTVYNSESQFPMTNYYELEGRVHADSWSIPIKKSESLGKCLTACIRMVKSGIVIEQDENCKKFLEKTIPVAFEKVVMTLQ